MKTSKSRRSAIKSMSFGAAAVLLNKSLAAAGKVAANDTISIGLIGCGGRLKGALWKGIQTLPQLRVDAVCDVYQQNLDSVHAQVGGRSRDVLKTKDYREILDRKDIDAVVIATPNHLHAPLTIDAVRAGKHVYVEKPLTHKLSEGPGVLKAVKGSGLAVQVGAQQRTMPHVVILRDKLKSGELDVGPVHRIDMQWNRNRSPEYGRWNYGGIKEADVDWKRYLGPAPDQPFDPHRMKQWRWIWDFGNGSLGDLMVHWLDCTNYLFDLGMPKRIASLGGNYITKGNWESPDTQKTIFEYPERELIIDFQCTFTNDFEHGSMRILGERGTIYLDRGKWEYSPQTGDGSNKVANKLDVGKSRPGLGSYPGYNAEHYHIKDWIEAAASGRDPVDDVSAGVLSSDVCHHGNIALLERRLVEI